MEAVQPQITVNYSLVNLVIQIVLFVFMVGVFWNKVTSLESGLSTLVTKQDSVLSSQSQLFVLVERDHQQIMAHDHRLDLLEGQKK